MRKVYCDLCGNKYKTETKHVFIEDHFDYLQGHYENKKVVAILLLILKNFDMCYSCQKWWEMHIQKLMEEFENGKDDKKES